MNIIAHVLVTILFIKIGDLAGVDIFWAILFGVVIDLDHLIKAPLYLKQNGFKTVRLWNWRTSLQEPVSYLWIIPLAVYLQTWVPVFFFTIHLILDYMMSFEKQPFYPFSEFKIPKMSSKNDGFIGISIVVIVGCILLYLV
ncbi:MAG: hypothetical protein ACXABI_05345 [Candidatus Hodarchaeales archaeon]|jgi:membrane-bound metal-dependent hydrolase YbcI (DUF457 family)